MTLSSEPFGPGRVLTANGATLETLSIPELRALYRECGFLMFRGFNLAVDEFFQFGRRFMDRVKTTPEAERRQHPLHRGLQTVTSGLHAMNFHADFGQLPNRPEVISFWCQTPPASGGETFVTDGVALWKALNEETRQLFLKQRIHQVSLLDHKLWTQFAGTDDFDVVKTALEQNEGVTVTRFPNGTITVEWKTWGAFKPKFSDELTFASNVFPFVYNGLMTLWEDGTPLPPAVIEELNVKAAQLCVPIVWAASDFVIVDNTRYLHARAAQDLQRKVFSLQGYISFQ